MVLLSSSDSWSHKEKEDRWLGSSYDDLAKDDCAYSQQEFQGKDSHL
jgi:hypothetical protein